MGKAERRTASIAADERESWAQPGRAARRFASRHPVAAPPGPTSVEREIEALHELQLSSIGLDEASGGGGGPLAISATNEREKNTLLRRRARERRGWQLPLGGCGARRWRSRCYRCSAQRRSTSPRRSTGRRHTRGCSRRRRNCSVGAASTGAVGEDRRDGGNPPTTTAWRCRRWPRRIVAQPAAQSTARHEGAALLAAIVFAVGTSATLRCRWCAGAVSRIFGCGAALIGTPPTSSPTACGRRTRSRSPPPPSWYWSACCTISTKRSLRVRSATQSGRLGAHLAAAAALPHPSSPTEQARASLRDDRRNSSRARTPLFFTHSPFPARLHQLAVKKARLSAVGSVLSPPHPRPPPFPERLLLAHTLLFIFVLLSPRSYRLRLRLCRLRFVAEGTRGCHRRPRCCLTRRRRLKRLAIFVALPSATDLARDAKLSEFTVSA